MITSTNKMPFSKPVVVIDNGSFSIKAGFACDNHPVSIFRTVVGRPSSLQGTYGRGYYDVHIGDEAVERIEELELNSPIVEGKIVHWDNMERIWHHVFYKELKAAPEDRSAILTCSATAPITEKIKCCEIFFETLNVPALCVQSQSVLSLYGSGFTTGLSVDLGYDTTDIVPVYEGGLVSFAHMQTKLAGSQISNYIKESLDMRSISFGLKSPIFIDAILKDCVYVTRNSAVTKDKYKMNYTLPSGEIIEVGKEAFMAGELIFQPDLVKNTKTSIEPLHEAVVTSVMKCDSELQTEMFDAIVTCGGLAMIPGLNKRLAIDLEKVIHRPVNIIESTEAYAVSWLGGATFAGMSDCQKVWVTKKHFEDYGEKIVRTKFL